MYDNKYLFEYSYAFKEYNAKQYINYLNYTTNIIDVFKYFSSKLFSIFTNKTYVDENYFNIYLNLLISYVNVNQNFLLLYLISEFDYNNAKLIINMIINKFNIINNTNVTLSNNDVVMSNNNYNTYNRIYGSKFNFIVIIYYYIYFIYKCMSIDIYDYNKFLDDLNANFINRVNVDLIVTFGEFIIKKYTTNIYNDCIENLIRLFTYSGNNINLDFSTYYCYLININTFNNGLFTQNNNFAVSEQNTYVNILNNNQEINYTLTNLNYSPIN